MFNFSDISEIDSSEFIHPIHQEVLGFQDHPTICLHLCSDSSDSWILYPYLTILKRKRISDSLFILGCDPSNWSRSSDLWITEFDLSILTCFNWIYFMEEAIEVSPFSNSSSCSRCVFFSENPESNHTTCSYHRFCFNRDVFNPEACDIYCSNRNNWFDNTDEAAVEEWKKSLVFSPKEF